MACADVMDREGEFRDRVPMANAVFVGLGDVRFADGSPGAGEEFARKAVHRGAAFGDLDSDGRVDVLVTALDGPLELWHNRSPAPHHWLLVDLVGGRSNRDAIGAKVKVVTACGDPAQPRDDRGRLRERFRPPRPLRARPGSRGEGADGHLAVGKDADLEGRSRRPGPARPRARRRRQRFALSSRKASNSCSAWSRRPSFW